MTDAGYFRVVAASGSVLIVLGTLTTSICDQYWQVILAQGICVGLGNGCLFCPTIAIVSTYFQKRRSLAIGITACGSGLGGIIYPLLMQELLPRVGFGWSVRTLGFVQAATLATALLCLKPRTVPRKSGKFVELAAFLEMEYTCYAIGCFLVSPRVHLMLRPAYRPPLKIRMTTDDGNSSATGAHTLRSSSLPHTLVIFKECPTQRH